MTWRDATFSETVNAAIIPGDDYEAIGMKPARKGRDPSRLHVACRRSPSSHVTLSWREMDSNHRYPER